jgi:hypothetical protein
MTKDDIIRRLQKLPITEWLLMKIINELVEMGVLKLEDA